MLASRGFLLRDRGKWRRRAVRGRVRLTRPAMGPDDKRELVNCVSRSARTLADGAGGSTPRRRLPPMTGNIIASGAARGPEQNRPPGVSGARRRGGGFGARVASLPLCASQCFAGKWRVPLPFASSFRRKPATALLSTKAPPLLALPPTVNAPRLVTNQMRPFPPDSTTRRDPRACVCSLRAWNVLDVASPTAKFNLPV